MSRFLSSSKQRLDPYVPGEQPRERTYVKLNTNECPYPPSPSVLEAVKAAKGSDFRLYPDPEMTELRAAAADYFNVRPEQVFAGGGSDEVLAYAFMAFFNPGDPVCYADITYGFYKVYANLFGLQSQVLSLREDYTLRPVDFKGQQGHLFLANPNAPTGCCLTTAEIEEILQQDPDRLVIVDEAYVDFAENASSLPLLNQYDNLLIVRTLSKSRAMAGARVGFGIGHPDLIADLNRMKYAFNPYNLSRTSAAAAIAALEDVAYFNVLVAQITTTRERVRASLEDMGFSVLPSSANFLFVHAADVGGEELYRALREKGVLVRWFATPRIREFVRVTVGTDQEMDEFLRAIWEICQT